MRYEQLGLALVYHLEQVTRQWPAQHLMSLSGKKRTIIDQANTLRDKKIILGLMIKSDESVCSSAF